MANQYFNFYYDPVRQGYDSNTWSTITGAPSVVGSQLSIDNAGVVHLSDLVRGDFIFNVNLSAPALGDDTKIGLTLLNKGIYLYFLISDDVLTAEAYDGVTNKSVTIDWQADWTSTNTEFCIKWEAGMATFSIGGNLKAVIDESIPGDPMSLYAFSNSNDPLLINYIEAKGVQSFI